MSLRKCGSDEYPIELSQKLIKPPSFNNAFFTNVIRAFIIGGSGCGKTTLLLNMLLENFKQLGLDYNAIILYAPQCTIESDLWQLAKNKFEEMGIDFFTQPVNDYPSKKDIERMKRELKSKSSKMNKNELNNYMKNLKLIRFDNLFNAQKEYPNLKPVIIFDDCVSYFKSKPQLVDDFREYLNNGTRANISAVFNIVQSLKNLDTDLRNSCSNVLFFPKTITPHQQHVITENMKENILSDRQFYDNLIKNIINSKHDYLLISFDAPDEKQVRYNGKYFVNKMN